MTNTRGRSPGGTLGGRGWLALLAPCLALAATVAACNVVEGIVDTADRRCADVDEPHVTITVGNGAIVPDPNTVSEGDLVCWETSDGEQHPLESTTTQSLGGLILPGGPLLDETIEPGTQQYYCADHEADGEVGTLIVNPQP